MNENYAYLPTTISEVDKQGNIVYSQWNYKILCHPIKRDVPLTRYASTITLNPSMPFSGLTMPTDQAVERICCF